MKREKNYKTARLIEALEYIDVRFIEEAAEKIKPRPTGQAFYGKPSRSKALRQFLALAACVLLLSAAIPAITYLANHLPDIVAFFIGDETTGTDPELTHPETPAPETTVPSPETTEIYHETTEEPWPSTTAPREETASPEETTAEETTSPPEPEYDGSVGLEYSIGGNAEIGRYMTLDGIGTCTDVDIVVASYYKGYPVKYIEQGAFYGQTQIKSIRLSGTVERIGSQAFRNCTSLESIYIGSGFREFNSNAFWGCGNISKIEIDPDNKFFEGVNCIIEKSRKALVRGCRTTVIPADGSVTRIDGLAFIDVHGLTSITIPEGVTSLGEDAFSGCPDLKSIHFSSTVNSFELVSVMGCDALEVITVDPKNPRFYSSGNCVIEKETGTLFLGCGGSVIPNDGSIKKIGYYAFGGNGSLVSVTVPEGVTYIDGYAFASCESLKSVYLPDSLITLGYGVFYHSSALESVRIGKNLETIGSSVFDECSKLNNLSFPKTLKRIGEMVFMECKSLASVSFEGTGAEWKAIEKVELWNAGAAFSTVHCSDGDLELYEYDGSRGLLYINYGSTAQLAGIGTCTDKDIVIASTYGGVPVVIIEDGVFKNNKNIRSVTISDKVRYIGKDAFAFCTSLESIKMPDDLRTLGSGAFNGCVALTSINIPAGITEIGSHTFSGCSSLKEITIPEGVTVIGNEAFYLCKSLKKVTLPSTLEYIKDRAFANCESLESIAIPDAVKWIGQRAFSDCAKLSTLTLGEGLDQIQENAFMNCASLKSVRFPRGLKLLAAASFDGCTKLANVSYGGSTNEWSHVGKEGAEWNSEWYRGIPATKVSCTDGEVSLSELTEADAIEAARKFWGLPSNAVLFAKERSPAHPDCYKIAYCEPSPIDFAVKREVFVDQSTGECKEVVYDYPNVPEVFLDVIFNREKFLYVEQTPSASGEYTYTTSEALFMDLSIHGDNVLGLQTLWYHVIDIDGDSTPELVFPGMARSNYGILLRAYEGKIYGYACILDGLHTDATYLWYEQAGNYRGRSQIYFDGMIYRSRTLTECDGNDPSNVIYYVEGKETTKERYEEFESAFSNDELEAFKLDYYPVYVNPFPGG